MRYIKTIMLEDFLNVFFLADTCIVGFAPANTCYTVSTTNARNALR